MHLVKLAIAVVALPMLTLTLAGCGGNGPDGPAPAPRPQDVDAFALTPAEAVERLPDAIVGRGGALSGQPVHYFEADPAATGYLAVPRGEGEFPAVILIHEWNGLGDRLRQLADDLAEEGYIALAIDLYSGQSATTPAQSRALMEAAMSDQERVIGNLDAAAAFLRARPDASGRIATIGWCFGGGVALSYAIGGENHDGTAMFYGRLVTDPEELERIDHPIHGTFAAKDTGIPIVEVEQFVAALRDADVANDIHIYDDVDHGFWLWVDQEPDVRARPALSAWQRLLGFLEWVL